MNLDNEVSILQRKLESLASLTKKGEKSWLELGELINGTEFKIGGTFSYARIYAIQEEDELVFVLKHLINGTETNGVKYSACGGTPGQGLLQQAERLKQTYLVKDDPALARLNLPTRNIDWFLLTSRHIDNN